MERLKGIGVSSGVAVGPALVAIQRTQVIRFPIAANHVARELSALERARKRSRQQLNQIRERIAELKGAELACVREARGADPVLLLDDVSSELDPARTGAVFEFLNGMPSQVFVTTTRPELFSTPGLSSADRADFRLVAGAFS